MEETLTRAIIPDLFNQRVGQEAPLTFQVISIREMRGAAGAIGYRLRLSDGQYTNQYIMYIGQRLDALQINCIIQATQWELSLAHKAILTIRRATILHTADEVAGRLGNPIPWKLGDPLPGLRLLQLL